MADHDKRYEAIEVSVADRVCRIMFNRPEKRNALNLTLLHELNTALRRADADDDIRAIVVAGNGPTFCSGVDLTEGRTNFDRDLNTEFEIHAWELHTPIIGAIHGAAIGVGLTLPLQWDIRVIAEDAVLSFAFARLGLIPEAGAHWFLPRLIGASQAADLLLTGRRFSGQDAYRMGLASRAVPADQVLSQAMEIATDIATNVSPLSAAIVKRLLWEFADSGDPAAALAKENRLLVWLASNPDMLAGVAAAMEKRAPEWKSSKHEKLPE
jgi:enoyl-CoA hydratase/carnithine racemase